MIDKHPLEVRAEQAYFEQLQVLEEIFRGYGVTIPQDHIQQLQQIPLRTASVEIPRLRSQEVEGTGWVRGDFISCREIMAEELETLRAGVYTHKGARDLLIGKKGEQFDDHTYKAMMRSEIAHLLLFLEHEETDNGVDEFYDLAYKIPLWAEAHADDPDYVWRLSQLCLGVYFWLDIYAETIGKDRRIEEALDLFHQRYGENLNPMGETMVQFVEVFFNHMDSETVPHIRGYYVGGGVLSDLMQRTQSPSSELVFQFERIASQAIYAPEVDFTSLGGFLESLRDWPETYPAN